MLNTYIPDAWRYAKGVVDDYEVGGIYSYFTKKEVGEDIEDNPNQWVFQMLRDRDSSGVVLDSSFAGWHQFMPRYYWFTFTMKMDGDTSVVDPVAEVHIWEELEQSKDYLGHIDGLLWEDLWDISEPPKADIIDTIYSTEFKHPGEYELIELDSIWLLAHDNTTHKQYKTHIVFKWLDTRDLYIDDLNVRDVYNYRLFASPNSNYWRDHVQDTLQARHNYAVDVNHPERNFRFYCDEPHINMYPSYKTVDSLSRERPEVPFNGATSLSLPKWDPLEFAQSIRPDELLFNSYTIHHDISTASSGIESLQKAWDRLIEGDSALFGMRYAKNAAETIGCRFWMFIQACADYYGSGSNWPTNLRAPTPNELFCEAHLALCYGATGIIYYTYPTIPSTGYRVKGLVDLVDSTSGDTTWTLDQNSIYVPNERWFAAQEINSKIDSLDNVLLGLDWISAFVSKPNSINEYATFVESLYSDEFGSDTSYVEIGEFSHTSEGANYLMLVNRRCLDIETQTVTVVINTAQNDAYMIEDAYNHDVYGGEDGVFSGITLGPGEGRLFKLVDSDETWSGTRNVKSSVTIPQDVQLTIEPGAVIKFVPGSGLQIDGMLSAKGTDSQYINFTASEPMNPWGGILFTDLSEDSLCVMKKCFIGYASTGIAFVDASTDTIDSILFHQCDVGISCENASPHISSPTIYTSGSVLVGIYCTANSAPIIDSVDFIGNGTYGSKGIHIFGSDPVIQGGIISNFARGINICGGDPDIRYVELRENTECAIACNWSEDQPPESECDACSAYIAYNDLFFNHSGIKTVNASPTVFYNRIVQSDSVGVFCSGTDLPNLGDLSNADTTDDGCNDIWDSQIFEVFNEATDTVQAENNWWGPDSLDPSSFSGPVDYIPASDRSFDTTAPSAIGDLTIALIKVPPDSGILLSWSAVTLDTEGELEFLSHYMIYRDTISNFEPSSMESLSVVPDTTFEYFDSEPGVVNDWSVNYLYNVKAVDYGTNKSAVSNLVGEFDMYLSRATKDPFDTTGVKQ